MEAVDNGSMKSRPTIHLKNIVDYKALIASIAICLITIPSIFIAFDRLSAHIIVSKGIQFVAIYSEAYAMHRFIVQYRKENRLRYAMQAFVLFFAIEFIFFVFLYPGGWRWDDVNIFNGVMQSSGWPTWQNYLTAVFYMVCMLTVPIPAFILLVQICLICAMSAFIAFRIKESTSLSGRAILIVGAFLLFLPPVVNMNLYPLRAALHSYLELLMFFILVDHYRNKIPWAVSHIAFFAILVATVAVWRTECMIFLVLMPVLFLILGWPKANKAKDALIFTVSLLLAFGILNFYQGVKGSPDYALTAYAPSLAYYAHQAKVDGDEEILNKLNEVYDVDVLIRAYEENVSGDILFWHRNDEWPFLKVRPDLSREDFYAHCREAFIEGTLKYPNLLLESRLKLIKDGAFKIISPGSPTKVYSKFPSFGSSYLLNDPIDSGLRMSVASFADAVGPQYEWVLIFYNIGLLLPCYLALYIYLIAKRSRLIFALLAFNAHHIVTALLAPTYCFMYYYSFYLGGVLIAAGFILAGFNWLKKRRMRHRKINV